MRAASLGTFWALAYARKCPARKRRARNASAHGNTMACTSHDFEMYYDPRRWGRPSLSDDEGDWDLLEENT